MFRLLLVVFIFIKVVLVVCFCNIIYNLFDVIVICNIFFDVFVIFKNVIVLNCYVNRVFCNERLFCNWNFEKMCVINILFNNLRSILKGCFFLFLDLEWLIILNNVNLGLYNLFYVVYGIDRIKIKYIFVSNINCV